MKIRYLRVSLTDRCNFNCIYCVPGKKVKMLKKDQLLSFEEITSLVKLLSPWGLDKVRLTGGEPLLRKDIPLLIGMLSEIENIKQITLTTNGFLLEGMAEDLKKAGLSRVNVSLDSLNREKFKKITGSDALIQVLRGIEAAKKAGLEPVKINTVVLKNINDDEVTEFVRFALENSLVLRFIEYMHFNSAGEKNWYIPNTLVKKIIEEKIAPLVPLESHNEQTAKYFLLKGTNLRVGFISPVSCPFCYKCSKLRLSADGKIRPCLALPLEVNIKKFLREKKEEQIKKVIYSILSFKERQKVYHPDFKTSGKFMFQIGG